jgi:hypothetical protein
MHSLDTSLILCLVRRIPMLEFHDRIPDLAGKMCLGLLVQRYFHVGKAVDAANAVLLHTDDQRWHRFFIDAGTVFWTIDSAPPPVPPSDGEHQYRIADIAERHNLTGHEIVSVRAIDLPGGGEIRFEFLGAPSVVLRDINDNSDLQLESAATSSA